MAQWLRMLTVHNWSSVSGTYRVEGKNWLSKVLVCCPHTCHNLHTPIHIAHTCTHTQSNTCNEKNITQQSRFKLIHTSVCVIHKLPAEGKKLSTEQPALLFWCVKFWDRQEEAAAGWLWGRGREEGARAISRGFSWVLLYQCAHMPKPSRPGNSTDSQWHIKTKILGWSWWRGDWHRGVVCDYVEMGKVVRWMDGWTIWCSLKQVFRIQVVESRWPA